MKLWTKSSEKILGFPAIKHSMTGEVALVCRHGEVWEDGKQRYGVLVTNNRIANWIAAKLDRRGNYKVGDEALFKITAAELGSVMVLLQPIRQQKRQIALAEYRFAGTIKTPAERDLFPVDEGEMDQTANHISEIEPSSSSTPILGGLRGDLAPSVSPSTDQTIASPHPNMDKNDGDLL